jgi:hypothetical protein
MKMDTHESQPHFLVNLAPISKALLQSIGNTSLCQWRSRNAQLWRHKSARAYKYLPLFQLNLKPTLAILGYQTLFSAFFEPVAIAFDVDGNAVM